jgi:methylated-DNA-[protein]-cysteine S-methyltransferase
MAALGFSLFETSIGHCGIAWSEHGLVGVLLPEASIGQTRLRMQRDFPQVHEMPPPPGVRAASERITGLLRGDRDASGRCDDLRSLELDMRFVSPFNRRVYQLTRAILPGSTLSYGALAARLGEPGAARAVGRALGDNPFAPVVPCHRVLAAGRRAGGFSAGGGVRTKLRMLEIEGALLGESPGLFDRDGPDGP